LAVSKAAALAEDDLEVLGIASLSKRDLLNKFSDAFKDKADASVVEKLLS